MKQFNPNPGANVSDKKPVLSINVTEKGEAGGGKFVATVPQLGLSAEGDSAIGAAAKAVAELKKHALQSVDEELSAQESLPLKPKGEKKLKAVKNADEAVESNPEPS